MTQEDKKLLLRDLCARLPYEKVVGKCELDASYDTSFDTILQTHKFDALVYGIKEGLLFVFPMIEDMDELEFANEEVAGGIDILDFKPYLFPLSSMTEEEKLMYEGLMIGTDNISYMLDVIDWLNAHNFDYRGLIEKGLAIDATNLNVY